MSNETCFKNDIVPNKNTKYDCRVLLKLQSVYYSMKYNDNIKYYAQISLEQCVYKIFF